MTYREFISKSIKFLSLVKYKGKELSVTKIPAGFQILPSQQMAILRQYMNDEQAKLLVEGMLKSTADFFEGLINSDGVIAEDFLLIIPKKAAVSKDGKREYTLNTNQIFSNIGRMKMDENGIHLTADSPLMNSNVEVYAIINVNDAYKLFMKKGWTALVLDIYLRLEESVSTPVSSSPVSPSPSFPETLSDAPFSLENYIGFADYEQFEKTNTVIVESKSDKNDYDYIRNNIDDGDIYLFLKCRNQYYNASRFIGKHVDELVLLAGWIDWEQDTFYFLDKSKDWPHSSNKRFSLALHNTIRRHPPRLYLSLQDYSNNESSGIDIMNEITPEERNRIDECIKTLETDGFHVSLGKSPGLFLSTKENKPYGAVTIFYPHVARKIEGLIGDNYYALITTATCMLIPESLNNKVNYKKIFKNIKSNKPAWYLTNSLFQYKNGKVRGIEKS